MSKSADAACAAVHSVEYLWAFRILQGIIVDTHFFERLLDFAFYAEVFGGTPSIMRFSEMPADAGAPFGITYSLSSAMT